MLVHDARANELVQVFVIQVLQRLQFALQQAIHAEVAAPLQILDVHELVAIKCAVAVQCMRAQEFLVVLWNEQRRTLFRK